MIQWEVIVFQFLSVGLTTRFTICPRSLRTFGARRAKTISTFFGYSLRSLDVSLQKLCCGSGRENSGCIRWARVTLIMSGTCGFVAS